MKEHPVPTPQAALDNPEVEAVSSAVEEYNFLAELASRDKIESIVSYTQYRNDLAFQYIASRQVAPTQQPQGAAPSSGGGGSCYGGVVPDYIVNRESGGDPNALNPSGAYGCYQIMPEWWAKEGPTGCAQFDRGVDGQKKCAEVIMNTQGMGAWG